MRNHCDSLLLRFMEEPQKKGSLAPEEQQAAGWGWLWCEWKRGDKKWDNKLLWRAVTVIWIELVVFLCKVISSLFMWLKQETKQWWAQRRISLPKSDFTRTGLWRRRVWDQNVEITRMLDGNLKRDDFALNHCIVKRINQNFFYAGKLYECDVFKSARFFFFWCLSPSWFKYLLPKAVSVAPAWGQTSVLR